MSSPDRIVGLGRTARLAVGGAAALVVVITVVVAVLSLNQPESDEVPSPQVLDPVSTTTSAHPATVAKTTTPLAVLPEGNDVGGGWTAVSPPPTGTRWGAVTVWTGEEIVTWGGAETGLPGSGHVDGVAYNPATDTWRELAAGPFSPNEMTIAVSGVWTGAELVVWTSRAGAAWDPRTDTWRPLVLPFRAAFFQKAVYLGGEIIDTQDDVAFDLETYVTRPLEGRPPFRARTTVVAGEGAVIPVTGGSFLDVAGDRWVEMPDSGLTPLATAGAWTGQELVAADYEMKAAAFDPSLNSWEPLPDIPLRFFECFPQVVAVGTRPVAVMCSGVAIWQPPAGIWIPIPAPGTGVSAIATDTHLFYWDQGILYRYDGDLDDPPTVLIAFDYRLDLPTGWRVISATGSDSSYEDFAGGGFEVVVSDGSMTCTLFAPNQFDPPIGVREAVDYRVGARETGIIPGLDSVLVPPDTVDDRYHAVVFAEPGLPDAGFSEERVGLDTACDDEPTLRTIAQSVGINDFATGG
jgi:hypothetical protein